VWIALHFCSRQTTTQRKNWASWKELNWKGVRCLLFPGTVSLRIRLCVCVCVCVVVGVSVSRSCNKKKHKIKWQRQKCFIKIYMSIICNCREKEEKRTRRKEKMEKEMLQRSLLRGVWVFLRLWALGGGRGRVRQWKLKMGCRCRKWTYFRLWPSRAARFELPKKRCG